MSPPLAHLILVLTITNLASSEIAWKVKPDPVQIVNENDSIQLNCEFKDTSSQNELESSQSNYFVIWYKDGASSNVLSLNDKLANLNNAHYEIRGKYNLVIRNVTKKDSGLYTCQLFQSTELVASVNLTVLVPPKHIELDIKSNHLDRSYYVENDQISIECCTNADVNPLPQFTWSKVSRTAESSILQINNQQTTMLSSSNNKFCNYLQLNLSRHDNDYFYKCSVVNQAIKEPLNKNIFISVEFKPIASLHLSGSPMINKQLALLEDTSVELFCNATALPNVISYQWFFNEIRLDDFTNVKSLKLAQLKRHQTGEYTCRAENKHGYSEARFRIEIIYAQISALNQTTSTAESQNLRQMNAVYINSVENSTITLGCRLDATERQKVTWFYYQLNRNGQIVNKRQLADQMSITSRMQIQKSKSLLRLDNLREANSGYYSCGISFRLEDGLKNERNILQNVTYYLQVQYSPVVTAIRQQVYAVNHEKVKLSCEVKSNPQSIIAWYFRGNEIQENFKYSLTKSLIKQFDHSYLDDVENMHSFVSTLTILSVTQFDYGLYTCRSNNIIGGNVQSIQVNKKQKPDTPQNLHATDILSNSIKLAWITPIFTGENNTFILNINRALNLTMHDLVIGYDTHQTLKQVEIKGLQPDSVYDFKILSYNSIGSSQFSAPIRVTTSKTQFLATELPSLKLAQFNDIREAVCFDLDASSDNNLNNIIVKVDLLTVNKTTDSQRTYLITLNKLKLGQNCILFPQLVEIDQQRQLLKSRPQLSPVKPSYNLLTLNQTKHHNIYTLKTFSDEIKHNNIDVSTLGSDFFEFKQLSQLNISICYVNDTQVCTEATTVNDYTSQFSMYITLIAVGCSAVLVLVFLLIASICCCYCCARKQQSQALKSSGLPLDQNLVIKSFPTITGHKQNNFDYPSDESTKSSQQNILNGSTEVSSHSSSSSGSHKYYNSTTGNKVIDMYDPNIQSRYIYGSNGLHVVANNNATSISTAESDISSSGNGSKSSVTHSPYTVLTDQNSNFTSVTASNYSKASASNGQQKQATTFVYNGTNYIKAYQTQTMNQQFKQMHQQYVTTNGSSQESPESGYSTPINVVNSSTIKKLVYEVIV